MSATSLAVAAHAEDARGRDASEMDAAVSNDVICIDRLSDEASLVIPGCIDGVSTSSGAHLHTILEPYLGSRWSKANYSAAERSMDGVRVRQFDADEIVAFARAFDLPITWFFMPPPPWASPGVPAKLQTPDAERFGAPLALLADLVFGADSPRGLMELRFQAFLDELGPNPLSDAQARVVESVEARKAQLVRHALGDLDRWQTQLRALANHLEDLEARAARQDNT